MNGVKWDSDLEHELFSEEEIEENNLRARLLCELIDARKNQGLTQRNLSEKSGLAQSAIARLEKGESSPTLDTLFKLLVPLGMTLTVVPISKN